MKRRLLLFTLAFIFTTAGLAFGWFWLESFARPSYHERWSDGAFYANANQFGQWTTAHGPITDHAPVDEYAYGIQAINLFNGFTTYRTKFFRFEPTSPPKRIVIVYRNIPYGLAIPFSCALSALCIFFATKRRLRSLLACTLALIAISFSLLWIRNPATLYQSDGLSRSWVIDGRHTASTGFFFHGGCIIFASEQESARLSRGWVPPFNVAQWIISPNRYYFSPRTTCGFGQGKSSYVSFATELPDFNRQWLSIPLWPFIALTAVPAILLAKPPRKRPKPGHCPKCAYDLRAHKLGEKCPECGTVRQTL